MFKKLIFDYARKAKKCSFGGLRSRSKVISIVIHNTGNNGDTARNNVDYFAAGNTRSAGAHIFIDRFGLTGRSIPLNRIAYSVGNPAGSYKKGVYYSTVNNSNSVSIELCDITNRAVSVEQKAALIKVCKWLKKQCPNIVCVVRHFDVVQKDCPHYYVKNTKEWLQLQKDLMRAIGLM